MAKRNVIDYRAGFIHAMKDIQADRKTPDDYFYARSEDWGAGYKAGLDHFNGRVNPNENRAHEYGLVSEYAGFYGQSGFVHPAP